MMLINYERNNSIFHKPHITIISISIQKNKCYFTLPYHGELTDKMKQIFLHYHISTHFTPINTLMNALVHPRDGQKSHQGNFIQENLLQHSLRLSKGIYW